MRAPKLKSVGGMSCSRCASDAGRDPSVSPSSLGLAARVAVAALICPECGSLLDDGAFGAAIYTILGRLDRFGLTGRGAPLLDLGREDG